jgi:AcrR family transcriptional regulator
MPPGAAAPPKARTPSAVTRSTYHHGDLKKALGVAAWTAIAELGPAGTSLREVARRTGVSATAALHHYGDKETLLAAVAVEGFRRLRRMRAARQSGVTDATERLRIHLAMYVRFSTQHPAVFELMYGGLLASIDRLPELRVEAMDSFGILKEAVGAYLAQIGATSPQVSLDAWTAWASVHGLATLAGAFPDPKKRPGSPGNAALTENMIQLMLDGLAAKYAVPAASGRPGTTGPG